jgi:chaperonin GroES
MPGASAAATAWTSLPPTDLPKIPEFSPVWAPDLQLTVDTGGAHDYLAGTLKPRVPNGRLLPLGLGVHVQSTRSYGDFFMKIRPLHDRVLVRRVDEEEKSAGGIIIPDTAKEKPMEGEVVAAGKGARGDDGIIHPLEVKKGDRILFGKWSGTEVRLDGEDLLVMKESDIMGIIE